MKNKVTKTTGNDSLKVWSDLNDEFDFGDGVTVSMSSHKDKNDKEGTTELFYSNKAPKLKVRGQEIAVEYSSTEQDDQTLLHFLAGKI